MYRDHLELYTTLDESQYILKISIIPWTSGRRSNKYKNNALADEKTMRLFLLGHCKF